MRLDVGEFPADFPWEVGVESVLDHGRVRRGHNVEMQRLAGMHHLAPEYKKACHLRTFDLRTLAAGSATAAVPATAAEPGGITFTVR